MNIAKFVLVFLVLAAVGCLAAVVIAALVKLVVWALIALLIYAVWKVSRGPRAEAKSTRND